MRRGKAISLATLAIVLSCIPSIVAAETFDKGDGWYKWSIEGAITRKTCNLDAEHGTIISDSDCDGQSGKLTFYVRSRNGEPALVRAFDSSCPVSTEQSVTDLGSVSSAESDSMLLEIVQARDLDMDVREEALFWLVQAGSDATFDYLDRLLSSK